MITQFVEELPEGKTTPDFTRKPIALTIQEGTVNIYAKDDGCGYVMLWLMLDVQHRLTYSKQHSTQKGLSPAKPC